MEANDLILLAKKYQEQHTFINNEEATKMALIVPFIRLLGYDTNSPREVRPEYQGKFIAGDGKKYPDRMDYAVFGQSGENPRFVIEAKPLGSDLKAKSQQLARYISQEPLMHFGIITDGCHYLFFGDLDSPNQMDGDPFFSFSLNDPKEDWARVAEFLAKFARDEFNAETLVTDAEDSRYRREMIAKLVKVMRDPASDADFVKWWTDGIYTGKRTTGVMERLCSLAVQAIEPALFKVLGKSIAASIEAKFDASENAEPSKSSDVVIEELATPAAKYGIETTDEEIEFHRIAQAICKLAGYVPEDVLHKDTRSYFNVSFQRPTKWFLRWFGDAKAPFLTCLVPVDRARKLAGKLEVAEHADGTTRIYLHEVQQLWALQTVVLESLEIMQSQRRGKSDDDSNSSDD